MTATAPLVTPLGNGRSLVTFVFLSDEEHRNVTLNTNVTAQPHTPLTRVDGSPLWFHSCEVDDDVRSTYQFCVDDPMVEEDLWNRYGSDPQAVTAALMERMPRLQADPLNPLREAPALTGFFGIPVGPEAYDSVLAMPASKPQPVTQDRGAPQGTVEQHRLGERDLWTYTPAGFDARRGWPLVVLLDGAAWVHVAPLPLVLDNLIADGAIPPCVAVMVGNLDPVSRNVELTCNPGFAGFLAGELREWAAATLGATCDPARTVVGGVSFGGLAAAHAALTHPEAFGGAIALSGSFWWAPGLTPGALAADHEPPGWLGRQLPPPGSAPQRFYLDCGRLEDVPLTAAPLTSQLGEVRHFRDALQAAGHHVTYAEFAGGHDFANWRATIADGLVATLGLAA